MAVALLRGIVVLYLSGKILCLLGNETSVVDVVGGVRLLKNVLIQAGAKRRVLLGEEFTKDVAYNLCALRWLCGLAGPYGKSLVLGN